MYLYLGEEKWNLRMLGENLVKSADMSVSVQCQFLLTLAILRRGYDYSEAAEIFGMTSGSPSQQVW